MDNKPNFPADASTMNTLIEGVNSIVLALATCMPPGQRQQFADHLSRLAANAERNGDTQLETLLIEFHRMARR